MASLRTRAQHTTRSGGSRQARIAKQSAGRERAKPAGAAGVGLEKREVLLRFDGALRRDPRIEAWFSAFADPLRLMVRPWFDEMRGSGPDVRELFHDGCAIACVGDAPFGYVNAFKTHAIVGFYLGAALADPAGLLQGEGKRMRHVKLRPGEPVDGKALSALIRESYRDIRRRLALGA